MAFALFLDMLGTRALIEALSISNNASNLNETAQSGESSEGEYKSIRQSFTKAIRWACRISSEGLIFRASFSDCAYLVYSNPSSICSAAYHAMSALRSDLVPTRGGIGQGSFWLGSTRHGTENTHCFTEAEFYGSCITHAHTAESCGLRGMRVFIHDSAFVPLRQVHSGINGYKPVDWSTFEEGDIRISDGVAISLEEPCGTVIGELSLLGDYALEDCLKDVERMQQRFPTGCSATALEQYESTREAMKRMHKLRMAS